MKGESRLIARRNFMLTVMTPTYNRAYMLKQCYDSLCAQTDKRFVWTIIDDGSTDETELLVKEWINESKIRINYIYKENGGKASALNVGIDNLSTEYAVCLDSDDLFFQDTIFKALILLNSINSNKKCCGILALRHNANGHVMGERRIPSCFKYITAKDVFLKLDLKTELICFYKSDILKKYKFPEYPGEKFVSPAWMQYKICEDYYFIPSNEKFCQCEYVSDGLTKNKNKVIVHNPNGYTCVKKYSFELASSLKLIIKHGIMFDCGYLLSHNKEWIKKCTRKQWAFFLMPIALVVKIYRFRGVV